MARLRRMWLTVSLAKQVVTSAMGQRCARLETQRC
jgi:hypothetical protein